MDKNINYEYSVPESWYENLYKDKKPCCSAARSFSLLHEKKPGECWLLLHGYRGYPGELVRPAEDLFKAGFDVYVPRLPGHGTCGDDFIQSHGSDWVGIAENALKYLKTKYDRVNILGHSMATATAAILGSADPNVGKIVYVCPSFENKEMNFPARVILKLASPFTPRIKCKWHASSKYHLHYENAPCDETYLGKEYFQYYFTKKLGEYYKIMKAGLKAMTENPHEHLVVYPMKDHVISEPSVELYKQAVKHWGKVNADFCTDKDKKNSLQNDENPIAGMKKASNENIEYIENGTHCIFYDKDPEAEEQAVQAVLKFACGVSKDA